MKKRFLGIFAAFAIVLGLCIGLTGCGDNKKEYLGSWEIVGMTNDGVETAQADIELMKSFGLTVTLSLDEDGTGVLSLFGVDYNVTWEVSGDSATLEYEGGRYDMKVEDGNLSMISGDNSIVFAPAES